MTGGRESLFAAERTSVPPRSGVGFEIGRGWRTLRFSVSSRRWPTVMGENPPRGVPYRNIEASYGSHCVQIRLWNWRNRG